MSRSPSKLPIGVSVFERGWLSANNILFVGDGRTALVDSGYTTHSEQTVALVGQGLAGRPLDYLLNTHLHSDHCGGNSALQARHPQVQTHIPPGLAQHVAHWNPEALSFTPTGQACPQFTMDGFLVPGTLVELADIEWEIHAAPGHDPHSIIFFEPQSRVLISADALWENGFGVVFPELEGDEAFDEVAATLDLIEGLRPQLVVPGHGTVFSHVAESLASARRRLDSFVINPRKHAGHAAKVLMKFKLLELQRVQMVNLLAWARVTPYFTLLHQRWFPHILFDQWIRQIAADLEKTGAAFLDGPWISNR